MAEKFPYIEELARIRSVPETLSETPNEPLIIQNREESRKMRIIIPDLQPREAMESMWTSLLRTNVPEKYFKRGNELVSVNTINGQVNIKTICTDHLYSIITKCTDFFKRVKNNFTPTSPKRELLSAMIADPSPKLPELNAVRFGPTRFPDASVVSEDGYYSKFGTMIHAPALRGLNLQGTERITPQEAVSTLIELFEDFEFKSETDKTNMLSFMLTPFVMVDGPSPLFFLNASVPGSGKTLLVRLVALLATGKDVEICSFPKQQEETRKRITAILRENQVIAVFDNIANGTTLDSPELAALITSTQWKDRLLGVSKVITVPNKTVWCITGNNITLTPELLRRSVVIELQPKQKDPHKRNTSVFRFPNIVKEIKDNLSKYQTAIFALISTPLSELSAQTHFMGSFEEWEKTLGSILFRAGRNDFLKNTDDNHSLTDPLEAEINIFISMWYGRFSNSVVEVRQLLNEARNHMTIFVDCRSEQGEMVVLGKLLRSRINQVFDGDLLIRSVKDGNGKFPSKYRLESTRLSVSKTSSSCETPSAGGYGGNTTPLCEDISYFNPLNNRELSPPYPKGAPSDGGTQN